MQAEMRRTVCFLSARNLGDAVVHADFVRALVESDYAERYIIWTFPQGAFLFEGIAQCTIVASAFPMGATVSSFIKGGFLSFVAAVRRIRRERPTETLELVSDLRERAACWLLGARLNRSPAWAPGHPFLGQIRTVVAPRKPLVTIPVTTIGLYQAYDLMLLALTGTRRVHLATTADEPLPPAVAADDPAMRIGIHPFASRACKLWPQQHWLSLIAELSVKCPDARLVLFGSLSDRPGLERLVESATHKEIEVFTASLREFKEKLRELDLMIGLDSFSVHLANSVGVSSIVLVGPNDPRLFTPPRSKAVTHVGGCVHQPCGGKPKCIGSSFEFICMKAISPEQVMSKVALRAE
jgi:heptosyltransferase III